MEHQKGQNYRVGGYNFDLGGQMEHQKGQNYRVRGYNFDLGGQMEYPHLSEL